MLVLSHPLRLATAFLALAAGVTAAPWIRYYTGPIGTDTKSYAAAASCLWGATPEAFTHGQRPLKREEAWDDWAAPTVMVSASGKCLPFRQTAISLDVDKLSWDARIRSVARSKNHDFAVVAFMPVFDFATMQVVRPFYGTHRNWATEPTPWKRAYALR